MSMNKIVSNRRVRIIGFSLFSLALISFGAYIRPGLDLTIEVASAFVEPEPEVFTAPPSESEMLSLALEKEVDRLWKSEGWQGHCREQAKFNVSYDLMIEMQGIAGESLDKSEFPKPASMPMSQALEASVGKAGRSSR